MRPVIAEHGPTRPVQQVSVNDEFSHSGPAGALLEQFDLCGEHIAKVTQNLNIE